MLCQEFVELLLSFSYWKVCPLLATSGTVNTTPLSFCLCVDCPLDKSLFFLQRVCLKCTRTLFLEKILNFSATCSMTIFLGLLFFSSLSDAVMLFLYLLVDLTKVRFRYPLVWCVFLMCLWYFSFPSVFSAAFSAWWCRNLMTVSLCRCQHIKVESL